MSDINKILEGVENGTKKEKSTPKKTTPSKSKPKKTKAEETVEKLTKNTINVGSKQTRDMNEMVSVICITNSPLIYESKSQLGYRVDWDGYLSENWVEYKELINMRSSQRAFFEEPWIICEWDILEDLRVTQYYKNIIDLENLDDIFLKSTDELENILQIVPKGIKQLIVDRAFEMRRNGELDSISVVNMIEKTLNIDLTV